MSESYDRRVEQTRPIEKIPEIQVIFDSPSLDEDEDETDPLWVDFDNVENEEEIKTAGPNTYVISPVIEGNLFSDKYINCTGIIGIGRDKGSNSEIAFISHQDPEYFIHKKQEKETFSDDLKTIMLELLSKSKDGTVKFVLFGGNHDQNDPKSKRTLDYNKSKDFLIRIIQETTGITPTVISGPKDGEGDISVTLSTQERKIYIEG